MSLFRTKFLSVALCLALPQTASAQLANFRGQTVEVPAAQLLHTVRLTGVQEDLYLSDGTAYHCTISISPQYGGSIFFDFLPINPAGLLNSLAPPIDPPPIVCRYRILDYTLNDRWSLRRLTNVVEDCDNGATVSIRRVSSDPADMTHEVEFSAPRNRFGTGCTLRIGTAVLFGPQGDVWNNGF